MNQTLTLGSRHSHLVDIANERKTRAQPTTIIFSSSLSAACCREVGVRCAEAQTPAGGHRRPSPAVRRARRHTRTTHDVRDPPVHLLASPSSSETPFSTPFAASTAR